MNIRKYFLCILALTALSAGCEDPFSHKSPTSRTPASRAGLRHELNPDKLVAEMQKPPSKTMVSDLKTCFVMPGRVGDYGFAYAQNQGLLALRDKFGMDTLALEDVPEDERSLAAMRRLADNGCRIIFAPGHGYAPYTLQMAENYPDIYFFGFDGREIRPNLSQYFGRMYQVRYLTGIVAGLRTKTGRIGFVAAKPVPQVFRAVNAFALGVKLVNKEARIYLRWSDSWDNSKKERELAMRLIDEGCDVLAQHQNSVAAQIAAEERGIWSIGYNSSMAFFAPHAYLTGASWNWAPYMIEQVKNIHEGTWKPAFYWGGLNDGVVALDPLTSQAPLGAQDIVDDQTRAIQNGYDVFTGPIYDNTGRLAVAPGKSLSDAEMLSMNWLAANVVGDANP